MMNRAEMKRTADLEMENALLQERIAELEAQLAERDALIEVEREAARISRNKAIENYRQVRNMRAYLDRRVSTCDRTMATLAEFAQEEPVDSHAHNHRIAEHHATAIRRNVYRKLIDIMDRGDFSEETKPDGE